jgi:hypothetical protein
VASSKEQGGMKQAYCHVDVDHGGIDACGAPHDEHTVPAQLEHTALGIPARWERLVWSVGNVNAATVHDGEVPLEADDAVWAAYHLHRCRHDAVARKETAPPAAVECLAARRLVTHGRVHCWCAACGGGSAAGGGGGPTQQGQPRWQQQRHHGE